jgi:hypothetical protein
MKKKLTVVHFDDEKSTQAVIINNNQPRTNRSSFDDTFSCVLNPMCVYLDNYIYILIRDKMQKTILLKYDPRKRLATKVNIGELPIFVINMHVFDHKLIIVHIAESYTNLIYDTISGKLDKFVIKELPGCFEIKNYNTDITDSNIVYHVTSFRHEYFFIKRDVITGYYGDTNVIQIDRRVRTDDIKRYVVFNYEKKIFINNRHNLYICDTKSSKYTVEESFGEMPKFRPYTHTVQKKHLVFMYGGGGSVPPCSDLYVFNITTYFWTKIADTNLKIPVMYNGFGIFVGDTNAFFVFGLSKRNRSKDLCKIHDILFDVGYYYKNQLFHERLYSLLRYESAIETIFIF